MEGESTATAVWAWINANKQWVFSGAGITILSALAALLRWLFRRRRRSTTRDSDRPLTSIQQNDARNRQAMLDKVNTMWIRGFLEHSPAQEERLTLGLTATPDAVERPMDILVQRPGQADRPLPLGDPIINEYDAMGGSLLILGAPGAGKTTLLLELLRDLLQRAQVDATHRILSVPKNQSS